MIIKRENRSSLISPGPVSVLTWRYSHKVRRLERCSELRCGLVEDAIVEPAQESEFLCRNIIRYSHEQPCESLAVKSSSNLKSSSVNGLGKACLTKRQKIISVKIALRGLSPPLVPDVIIITVRKSGAAQKILIPRLVPKGFSDILRLIQFGMKEALVCSVVVLDITVDYRILAREEIIGILVSRRIRHGQRADQEILIGSEILLSRS